MSVDESMRLSHVRLIADGALRCIHVARERGRRRFISSIGSSSDDRDNSMCPSGALNLNRYNSEMDGWDPTQFN